jgi:hypothetical protein
MYLDIADRILQITEIRVKQLMLLHVVDYITCAVMLCYTV